jgi:hypothetical protein
MKIETSSPTIEIITGQILSEIEQYMLRINVQFPISDDVTNFYEVYECVDMFVINHISGVMVSALVLSVVDCEIAG